MEQVAKGVAKIYARNLFILVDLNTQLNSFFIVCFTLFHINSIDFQTVVDNFYNSQGYFINLLTLACFKIIYY